MRSVPPRAWMRSMKLTSIKPFAKDTPGTRFVLHCGLLRAGSTEQVHKEAIGAGNAFRELPKERQPGVDVSSIANFAVHQPAIQIFFAGIVHAQQRSVFEWRVGIRQS